MQSRLGEGLLPKLGAGGRVGHDLARVGAGLGRGATQQNTLVAAPWANTWPASGATLDLDFANDRGWVRGIGQGRSMDAVTFTRASNGTFVGSDGLLKSYANQGALGNNLFSSPQNFNDAAWSKSGTSVITNTAIAPDQTLTATKLYNTGNANTRKTIQQGNPEFKVFSCYAKAAEWNYLTIGKTNNGGYYTSVNFNLNTSQVTVQQVSTSELPVTQSIEPVGDGWYRCIVVWGSASNGNGGFLAATPDGDPVWGSAYSSAGNGISGIYIWGAQLENGSTVTQYFPTNINTPRFDWASTATMQRNVLTNTENINSTNYTNGYNGGTFITASTESPTGTLTATKLVPNVNATEAWWGKYNVQSVRVINDGIYTFSAYFKAAEYSVIELTGDLRDAGGININARFDLVNVTATLLAGVSASIIPADNGWYRCSATGTSNSTTDEEPGIIWRGSAANGSSGIHVWGLQFESGSAATEYQTIGAHLPTRTTLAPTSTCNGLLIEEARTNRLLWNRDATQTVWIKTNMSASKDQTGIDGVANSATSITASGGNATLIQSIVLASGARTNSVYLKRLIGSGSVQVSLDGSTWSGVDLVDTEWRRIVMSGTVTNPVMGIRLVTSGDAVVMDFAQVEDGSFVTTPILTTSATVTRAAESANIPISYAWYSNGAQTIVAASQFANYYQSGNGRFGGIAYFGSGVNPRAYVAYGNGTDRPIYFQLYDGTRNLSGKGADFNDLATGRTHIVGLAYDNANAQLAINGVPGAAFTSNYVQTPILGQSLFIGLRVDAGNYMNGWISSVKLFPKRLNTLAINTLTGTTT